jgi:thioredoxin reductase (NADPH)
MSEQKIYDTIIVGAGAAGLTAALYASRRAMKTLVISQDIGGQAAMTNEIENYPGVDFIPGPELMNKFKAQAEKFGAEFAYAEVVGISKNMDEKNTPVFTLSTNTDKYVGNAVILAFGLTHRHLGVPGEKEFGGKGVSYCATCDAPLFKGRTVAVVGGGNSGVDAALLLAKMCPKVYLVHQRAEFNAEAVLVEQLKQSSVELVLNSKIKEIQGDARVQKIIVQDVNDENKTRAIDTEGVFVEIGFVVDSKLIEGLVELDPRKQIKISTDAETSQPGIFAAGDITNISFKQVVISAGWGATAALKAYEYLQKVKGFRGVSIDWGVSKKSTIMPVGGK